MYSQSQGKKKGFFEKLSRGKGSRKDERKKLEAKEDKKGATQTHEKTEQDYEKSRKVEDAKADEQGAAKKLPTGDHDISDEPLISEGEHKKKDDESADSQAVKDSQAEAWKHGTVSGTEAGSHKDESDVVNDSSSNVSEGKVSGENKDAVAYKLQRCKDR